MQDRCVQDNWLNFAFFVFLEISFNFEKSKRSDFIAKA